MIEASGINIALRDAHMRGPILALGLLSATAAIISISPALATTVTVAATQSIYNYDQVVAGSGSTLSVPITLLPGAGRTITFTGISGEAFLTSGYGSQGDGFYYPGTAVSAISGLNGLSGLVAPNEGFLTGVFLNGSEAATDHITPASIDLTVVGSETFTSMSPIVDQVFFIGDGLTGDGTGQVQQFVVPDDATSLALGFVDAFGFEGVPGAYFDNTGSLMINVNSTTGASPVPEPSGALMLLAGLIMLTIIHVRSVRA